MKQQPTYKLRKLTIGFCSVAFMALFATQMPATTAHADDSAAVVSDAKDAGADQGTATDTDDKSNTAATTDQANANTNATTNNTTTDADTNDDSSSQELPYKYLTLDDTEYVENTIPETDPISGSLSGGDVVTDIDDWSMIDGQDVMISDEITQMDVSLFRKIASRAHILYVYDPLTLVSPASSGIEDQYSYPKAEADGMNLLGNSTTLEGANLSGLDLTNVPSMAYAFANAPKLQWLALPTNINPKITSLMGLFYNDKSLMQNYSIIFPDAWKNLKLTNTSMMFKGSGVLNYEYTYTRDENFKLIDYAPMTNLLTGLDLSNVTDAKQMFADTTLRYIASVPKFADNADLTGLYQNTKGMTQLIVTNVTSNQNITDMLHGASDIKRIIGDVNQIKDMQDAFNTGNREMSIYKGITDTVEFFSYTKALSSDYKIYNINDDPDHMVNTSFTIYPVQDAAADFYSSLVRTNIKTAADKNTNLSDQAKAALKKAVDEIPTADWTEKINLSVLDQVARFDKYKINTLDISWVDANVTDEVKPKVLKFVANKPSGTKDATAVLHIKSATYVPGVGYVTYGTERTVNINIPDGMVWRDADPATGKPEGYYAVDNYNDLLQQAADAMDITADDGYTFDDGAVTKPKLNTPVTTDAAAMPNDDDLTEATLYQYDANVPTVIASVDEALNKLQPKLVENVLKDIDALKTQYPDVTFNFAADGVATVKGTYSYKLGDNTITSNEIRFAALSPFKLVDGKTVTAGDALTADDLVADKGSYSDFTVTGYDPEKVGKQTITVTGKDNAGETLSLTTTVEVKAKAFKLVDGKTVTAGDALTADDLVADKGSYSDFTVTGYDPEKVGKQTITVTGKDDAGETLSLTTTVEVKAKAFKLVNGKTVTAGDGLTADDLVADKGSYSDFTVTGYDPEKVGKQTITVTGKDDAGETLSLTTTVEVKAKAFKLVNGKTVTAGDGLTADDLVADKGSYSDFTV
ncbi:MAG: BspA family leucine-rich repeat surface protein, partial [Limosilactobacillus sp.]|uniref:BspA family leucine-rich repeat surface protein n=1 Tax=Limosilactobacillus sp. TaxID=2773925 RepID=UPI0027047C88|nr:BspA family leucine-rich repeat surface protein [Limosilactobacillus sp.]